MATKEFFAFMFTSKNAEGYYPLLGTRETYVGSLEPYYCTGLGSVERTGLSPFTECGCPKRYGTFGALVQFSEACSVFDTILTKWLV